MTEVAFGQVQQLKGAITKFYNLLGYLLKFQCQVYGAEILIIKCLISGKTLPEY